MPVKNQPTRGATMPLHPISEWQDIEFGSPSNNYLDDSDDGIFTMMDEYSSGKQTGIRARIGRWLPFIGTRGRGNGYQQPKNIRVIHPPFGGNDPNASSRSGANPHCKRLVIGLIVILSVLLLLAVGYASVSKKAADIRGNSTNIDDAIQQPNAAQQYFDWLTNRSIVRTLQFEEVDQFSPPRIPEYRWTGPSNPDGSFLEYQSSTNQILLKSLDPSVPTKIIADSNDLQKLRGHRIASQIQLSVDGSRLLVEYDEQPVWRSSSLSRYSLLDLQSKRWFHLPKSNENSEIAFAKWSTSAAYGLVFNQNRDLYWFDGVGDIYRLTSDATTNAAVFNGLADWVYEEEVFGNSDCTWWSPDGQKLAYLSFDESEVMNYPLSVAGVVDDNQYPSKFDIKYPKPGTPNPKVKLRVVDFGDEDAVTREPFVTRQLVLPFVDEQDRQNKDSPIVYGVFWVPDSKRLLVKLSNRNQDHQFVVIYELASSKSPLSQSSAVVEPRMVREEQRAWFERGPSPVFLEGNEYLDLVPLDGYLHLARFQLLSAKPTLFLTRGQFEVVAIKGRLADNSILFVATGGSGGVGRDVYSLAIKDPDDNSSLPAPRLFNQQPGYYDVSMSPKGSWVILSHLGPQVPFHEIINIGGKDNAGPANRTVTDDSDNLKRKLNLYTLPSTELRQIPASDNGLVLNARITWPPGFQRNLTGFYPLLVKVYGGPNSQQVDQQWSISFDTFLASNWHRSSRSMFQKGQLSAKNVSFSVLQRRGLRSVQPPFIVIAIDPRGTGGRGLNFSFAVQRNLGHLESQDIVAAVKRFVADHPFVDPDKIGIWGWSYGGYLAAKVIETDFLSRNGAPPVFKAAVSVAPVTDWRLYDSIYTERYMKRPSENPQGYRDSAISNSQALKSIRYLEMHGTADDNVHVEQSLRLEYLLRKESALGGTNYRLHLVADDNHSMYRTKNARNFVYHMVAEWLVNAWQEVDDLRRWQN